jgi:hypothetical protein
LAQFSKSFRSFYPKNCHQALKNMGLGSGIRDPGSGKKPIPDLGSQIQGSKRHRIPDPDPQHCVFSPLFDRTPISRDRDCCGLTEISEISGRRQYFGLCQTFDHFLVWQAGTSSRYSTGESPQKKAGHRESLPHAIQHICKEENETISGA